MATSNFKVFNETLTNAETDAQYAADSQRLNGVVPGVAPSALHNKLFRQVSIMAAALGQVVANQGYNASDADETALVEALTSVLVNPAEIAFMSRQALINGNFDVWQRGTSFTNPAAGTYTADRFFTTSNLDGGTLPTSIVHSQTNLASGELDHSFYCYSVTVNGSGSGYGANAVYGLFQRIGNGVRFLCGNAKKVTVSFWARSNISGKRIGIQLKQKYGSGGSPSSDDILQGNVFTLTSTWTKYTVTFNTSTLSGKAFGSNNDDNLQVGFYYLWGTTISSEIVAGGTTAETFGGSGFINIAQVQVCSGDQALPFQPRDFATELALCLRYFEKSYNLADAPGLVAVNGVYGFTAASASPSQTHEFKVRKRVAPTITLYSSATGNTGKARDETAGVDLTATVRYNGEQHFLADYTGTSVGNRIIGHWTADAEL